MEWKENFCPWTIRLGKGDFVRAAIAKADFLAKQGVAYREAKRGRKNAREEATAAGDLYRQEIDGDSTGEGESAEGERQGDFQGVYAEAGSEE